MARKIMIAGNWKMNGLSEDGVALAREVAAEVKKLGKPACEFLVCPPFTLLYQVKKALRGARSRSVRKMPILRSRALTPATSARPC